MYDVIKFTHYSCASNLTFYTIENGAVLSLSHEQIEQGRPHNDDIEVIENFVDDDHFDKTPQFFKKLDKPKIVLVEKDVPEDVAYFAMCNGLEGYEGMIEDWMLE